MVIYLEFSMNLKWALLFPSWKKFGESWNSCEAIVNELVDRGHEVQHYNTYHADGAILPKQKIRSYSNEGINTLVADCRSGYKPDIVFLLDYGPYDTFIFDKQYFPDSILVAEFGDEPQSHNLHWPKASRIHLGLSPDKRCVQHYNMYGFNVAWWTQFADHKVFYPRNIKPTWDVVSTCGGRKYTEEISLALGPRFNNERYFFGNDHAERLSMGKIVFQNSQYGEITRRLFEGMACKRMVLTDRLSKETGLPDIFIDGTDIVYYDDAKDAIDKINYFIAHDDEREQIAVNGYNKTMAGHTVKQRIDDLLLLIDDKRK